MGAVEINEEFTFGDSGGSVGKAYRDTVTSNYWAYGVAQLTDDWLGDYDATTTEQSIVVAHEMAHIMSCKHDNNTDGNGDYSIMAGGVAIDENDFTDEFFSTCESDFNDSADNNL